MANEHTDPVPPDEIQTLVETVDRLCGSPSLVRAAMKDPVLYNEAGQSIQSLIVALFQGRVGRSPVSGHVLLEMGLRTIHDTTDTPLLRVLSMVMEVATDIWGHDAVEQAAHESMAGLKRVLTDTRHHPDLPDLPHFDLKSMGSKKPTLH